MGQSNNHSATTGEGRLSALKAVGQFTNYGAYNTLTAGVAYAVDAAYDDLVLKEASTPSVEPVQMELPLGEPAPAPVAPTEESSTPVKQTDQAEAPLESEAAPVLGAEAPEAPASDDESNV